jgi:hypothetical protein
MEGRDRKLKAGCFACGDWLAVKEAIADEDYRPAATTGRSARTPLERMRTAQRVLDETIAIPLTPASRYLAEQREIDGPYPDTLRFHRNAWHLTGFYPAMAARIERFQDGQFAFAGVHLTYLAPSGRKAGVDPDKMTFGVVKGAGVWLAGRGRDGPIAVGEGIESTFSGMKILDVGAGVAALSAPAMGAIVLPPGCNPVWIVADHDASGAGERAADALARRLRGEGRAVRLAIPDAVGADFNEIWILRRKAA